MTTGKQSSSTYPYNPLPSTPQQQQQQPDFYVILPYYSGHRRRRHSCRPYISFTISILLIFLSLYFLFPSDPNIKLTNLHLNSLKINSSPISIDFVLSARIKVRNPDVYSLHYKSVNVSVEYRGEHLGFVTSDYGTVKAFGASYVDAMIVLNGAEVVTQAVFLVADLIRGSIPFTTSSEISGSLGVLFFDLPISAKLSCEVVMNIHNQTIERQDCYPA
ncbi:hypothetical protein QVD17_30019 [Tagetes erecta]|uniref:Late embryogenesis abundant protein LEA-2 subgroup domain-containing protein n=1 Tax=Tagetes erecta TaxID=13708 RepID=A0AAD8K0S2_TARER|nr:hypothetical protein QVD17_30019 [Tagetes erecta]